MDPTIGFDHRIKDLQSRRIAASMLIDEMEREAGIYRENPKMDGENNGKPN